MSHTRRLYLGLCILLGALLMLQTGCRNENFNTDSGFTLEFSVDTLTFDTVFTTLGSTTKFVKIFNRESRPVSVSSIRLAGGDQSNFRINVDGIPGDLAEDVEILGNDSLYVFVEVTVDPNGQNLPLIIFDSLLFETNGNDQKVILAAWGQDANFINGEVLATQTWNPDKPYVIFNSAAVAPGETLTINAGTQVHLSNTSALFVFGTLIANGGCMDGEAIVFQGTRLEDFYDDLPGQWQGIFIFRNSIGNVLNHCIIKNSDFGLNIGTATIPDGSDPLSFFNESDRSELTLTNSCIQNSFATAFFATQSEATLTNNLFYNAGDNMVSLFLGGEYTFTHNTFANYGSITTSHEKAILNASNTAILTDGENTVIAQKSLDLNMNFTNTILYGSLEEELDFTNDTTLGAAFNYTFDHCMVRTEMEDTTDAAIYINSIINKDPQFLDRSEDDFGIPTTSDAYDAGKILGPSEDKACRPRTDPPDIGCFEYFMD